MEFRCLSSDLLVTSVALTGPVSCKGGNRWEPAGSGSGQGVRVAASAASFKSEQMAWYFDTLYVLHL